MGTVVLKNCSSGGTNNTPEVFKDVVNNTSTFDITANDLKGVKSLLDYRFYNSKIKSIEIPETITSISNRSLSGCSDLESITGTSNNYTISDNCIIQNATLLKGCKNSILDTNSISNLGNYAFENNKSIESAIIPTGVTIREQTYVGCSNIKFVQSTSSNIVNILDNANAVDCVCSITQDYISNSQFSNRVYITTVEFPIGVNNILSNSFNNTGLTKLVLLSSPSIQNGAFWNCANLKYVEIPKYSGSVSVNADAFTNSPIEEVKVHSSILSAIPKTNLKKVEITDGTSIAANQFSNCTTLESIDIPNTITQIYDNAFLNCANLSYFNFNGTLSEWCSMSFGNEESNPIKYTHKLCLYGTPITKINITNSSVSSRAFQNCTNLKSIYFSDSVTTIGDYAFANCVNSSMILPVNLNSVGAGAFENCSNAFVKTISNNISHIGSSAFKNVPSNITSLVLSNLSYIGDGAFSGWSQLTSLSSNLFSGYYPLGLYFGQEEFTESMKVVQTLQKSASSGTVMTYYIPKSLTSVSVLPGVTILRFTFEGCSNLTSITLPNTLVTIDSYAFEGCEGLSTIVIPDGVTSIGYMSFMNCYNLTSIVIPDSVTTIGKYAFDSCTKLTSITIGSGVTNIYSDAFNNCFGITEIYNKSNLNISVGSSDNGGIGIYAREVSSTPIVSKLFTDSNKWLYYLSNYSAEIINYQGIDSSISIPTSVQSLPVTSIRPGAFYRNYNIVSVTFPSNSIGYIPDHMFYDCFNLSEINITSAITSIQQDALRGCSSLTAINYSGTISDWNSISFGYRWNLGTGDYIVHCTDGDIPKS